MCEQVSYKERKGGKKGCYGHVWTKDMSVKQSSVCMSEHRQSKQPAVCELAKLDMYTSDEHIHILAGVPTHPVAPNTPWPYLYSQQKHTHTHRAKFMHNQRYTNSTGGLTLTHMHKHTDPATNWIQQTGNKQLWSTEINDLIEKYNRRRKKFIPLFWTSKDPACFNKPNFMDIQINQRVILMD